MRIGELAETTGTTPCGHVEDLLTSRLANLDRKITGVEALRQSVTQLRDAASAVDPTICPPQDVCRHL